MRLTYLFKENTNHKKKNLKDCPEVSRDHPSSAAATEINILSSKEPAVMRTTTSLTNVESSI